MRGMGRLNTPTIDVGKERAEIDKQRDLGWKGQENFSIEWLLCDCIGPAWL